MPSIKLDTFSQSELRFDLYLIFGGQMKLYAVVCLFALSAAPAFANEDVETKDFDASVINALDMRNLSGDINLKPSQGNKAFVTITKVEFSDACTLGVGLNGKTLEVKVDKAKMLSNKSCKVNFDIAIPAGSALNISTASGDIVLAGMTGELNFRTASGSVNGVSELTKVTGRTASGDVELKNMIGPVDLQTASGDIVLGFKKIPTKGGVELVTASGSSEITLPRDSKVLTSFTAASGKLTNRFGDSPGANFRISARTASGDLTIKQGVF
jgi:DUF4097 and DUF4098 domain-containing protein YvlB